MPTELTDRPDVLIVGAGSCGSVLAARLSEDPACSVTLLEAGAGSLSDFAPEILDVGTLPVGPSSRHIRRFDVEVAAGKSLPVARGRGLGGSSAVNGAYFVRAPAADLNSWGSELWRPDSVRDAFARLETDFDFGDLPGHGRTGPMPVQRAPQAGWHPISGAFVDAATAAGFAEEPDKNGGGDPGVGPVPLNTRGGVRVNAALAYLTPASKRPNLRIHTGVRVRRVLLSHGVATGVEVVDGQAIHTLTAARIILCAGGIGSPLLLLRSGVGPPDDLASAGIETEHALPGVGRDFTDHPEIAVPYRFRRDLPREAGTAVLQVALNIDGGVPGLASPGAGLGSAALELRPYTGSFSQIIPGTEPGIPPYLGVTLMRPRSRGAIRLTSAGGPSIEYRYLEDPADRREAAAGVELAANLCATPAMRGLIDPVDVDPTDDWLHAHLGTSQHLCGSCRMGPADDPGAVVDERLRVHGIDGLYVVDTSVFPRVPGRGPHATAIMLAERAAELMR